MKGGRERKDRKGGRRRRGGVFVSQERDGGGEREPDVQDSEGKKEMIQQLHEKK